MMSDSTTSTSSHLASGEFRASGVGLIKGSDSSEFRSSQVIAPSSTFQARTSKNLEEFTVSKLRFQSLDQAVLGRDEEIKTLSKCLQSIPSTKRKQAVFLYGESGAGKSCIAASLKPTVARAHGMQIRGKFELYLRDTPFSGIVSLTEELGESIADIREKDKDKFSALKEDMEKQLGGQLGDLFSAFPALEHAFQSKMNTGRENNTTTAISMEAKSAFEFAFQTFIRLLTTHVQPFVMVFDDLQWADGSSLDLIKSLLLDDQNNSLMVIGVYRSNEVDEAHLLSKMKRELLEEAKNQTDVIDLSVGSLSVQAVNQVLQVLLQMDNDAVTMPLAQICHEKTLGNAFHLLQFISTIHQAGLLHFNFGIMSWIWDIESIRQSTEFSENVVLLLQNHMKKQSVVIQEILSLASFLGSTFEMKHLHLVWNAFHSRNEEDLDVSLSNCVVEGFLKSNCAGSYFWAHDKIQEAAFRMFPEEEVPKIRGRIGTVLLTGLREDELEASLFTIANLLNHSVSPDDRDGDVQLSNINLRSARMALRYAAYDSAARYVHFGIHNLPSSKWDTDAELCLELYSLGAETADYTGDAELRDLYCNDILARKDKLHLKDMFRVHCVQMQSLIGQNHTHQAVDHCVEVLAKYGCHFPKWSIPQKLSIVKGLICLRKRSKKTIDALPLLTTDTEHGEMISQQMTLLDKLTTACFFVKPELMILVIFRSLSLTFKHGLSNYSPVAAAFFGLLLASLNDFKGGAEYGRFALELLERVPNKKVVASRTIMLANFFAQFWTKHTLEITRALVHGYEAGMTSGDTENAMYSICGYIQVSFILGGKSLSSLETDCRLYTGQMKRLKRETPDFATRCLWQVILNLSGKNNVSTPTVLIGEAIDEREYGELASSNSALSFFLFTARLAIHNYFGDYEGCAGLVRAYGDISNGLAGHPCLILDAFHRALSMFSMAQGKSSRSKKYANEAMKASTMIQQWAKQGSANLVHQAKLMDAELARLKGKVNLAMKHYQDAVVVAARGGFVHDAAIASERFGFFMKSCGDNEEAAYRIKESIKYYREWGAHGKANKLEDQAGALLT